MFTYFIGFPIEQLLVGGLGAVSSSTSMAGTSALSTRLEGEVGLWEPGGG